MGPIREYARGNIPEIWPTFNQPKAKVTLNLMETVESAPNRTEGILNACKIVGIPIEKTEVKGRRGNMIQYKDNAGNILSTEDDFEDLLNECIIKLKSMSSFGKKKRSKAAEIFKKAAKKCKGKANYRKCFTKTLRKMHGSS